MSTNLGRLPGARAAFAPTRAEKRAGPRKKPGGREKKGGGGAGGQNKRWGRVGPGGATKKKNLSLKGKGPFLGKSQVERSVGNKTTLGGGKPLIKKNQLNHLPKGNATRKKRDFLGQGHIKALAAAGGARPLLKVVFKKH